MTDAEIGILALVVSVGSLLVSVGTLWWQNIRMGEVRMTHPAVIFFGPDGGKAKEPKVFLRSLIFCTAMRGRVVEHLHLSINHNGQTQLFDVWVYGDGTLARGSGIYVGQDGIACNHNFLSTTLPASHRFRSGVYSIEVVAKVFGESKPQTLLSVQVELSEGDADLLKNGDRGIYFDWNPVRKVYVTKVSDAPDLLSKFIIEPPKLATSMLGS